MRPRAAPTLEKAPRSPQAPGGLVDSSRQPGTKVRLTSHMYNDPVGKSWPRVTGMGGRSLGGSIIGQGGEGSSG